MVREGQDFKGFFPASFDVELDFPPLFSKKKTLSPPPPPPLRSWPKTAFCPPFFVFRDAVWAGDGGNFLSTPKDGGGLSNFFFFSPRLRTLFCRLLPSVAWQLRICKKIRRKFLKLNQKDLFICFFHLDKGMHDNNSCILPY